MSAEAARIVGLDLPQTVTQADLVPDLNAVISRGWSDVDGAVLLTSWYESYFGDRARFADATDFEVAVNGRGIPDLDLVDVGEARVSCLLRRGVAFAWAALHEACREQPDARMASYISAAATLVDPEQFTGNVTFCAVHPGQSLYIDPVRLTTEIVIAVFSEDCKRPLPAS